MAIQGHSMSCVLGSVERRQKGLNNTIIQHVYNNVGLISQGAEDIASESPENRRFRLPHCRLTPRLQQTPANIRINLILPETSHWATSSSLIVWSIFIHIFVVGSERRMCFETGCKMAVQGHPRSLMLAPTESAYATSCCRRCGSEEKKKNKLYFAKQIHVTTNT